MNNERFMELFREAFEEEMQAKTGWGRNEVMAVFDKTSTRAAMRVMDETKK